MALEELKNINDLISEIKSSLPMSGKLEKIKKGKHGINVSGVEIRGNKICRWRGNELDVYEVSYNTETKVLASYYKNDKTIVPPPKTTTEEKKVRKFFEDCQKIIQEIKTAQGVKETGAKLGKDTYDVLVSAVGVNYNYDPFIGCPFDTSKMKLVEEKDGLLIGDEVQFLHYEMGHGKIKAIGEDAMYLNGDSFTSVVVEVKKGNETVHQFLTRSNLITKQNSMENMGYKSLKVENVVKENGKIIVSFKDSESREFNDYNLNINKVTIGDTLWVRNGKTDEEYVLEK